MRPFIKSWIVIGLLSLSGCTICDAPHDYCGPTQNGQCGGGCDFLYRENSAFTGMSGVTMSEGEPTLVDESIEESARLQPIPHPHQAPMIGRRPHTNQMR